jgi:hypothetical protein
VKAPDLEAPRGRSHLVTSRTAKRAQVRFILRASAEMFGHARVGGCPAEHGTLDCRAYLAQGAASPLCCFCTRSPRCSQNRRLNTAGAKPGRPRSHPGFCILQIPACPGCNLNTAACRWRVFAVPGWGADCNSELRSETAAGRRRSFELRPERYCAPQACFPEARAQQRGADEDLLTIALGPQIATLRVRVEENPLDRRRMLRVRSCPTGGAKGASEPSGHLAPPRRAFGDGNM